MQPLVLTAGRLRLALDPQVGGSVQSLIWRDGASAHAVLRPPARAGKDVVNMASFPLVPFANRIRDGAFQFRGTNVRLAPNSANDPSPLHGHGWLAPWTVERASGRSAVLTFDHCAGEWPWRYRARQEIALDEATAFFVLECENLSDEPMPCGLGQHPFFPCGPATRIDTSAGYLWTIDERQLPVDRVPAAEVYSLQDRSICAQGLNHCYGDWTGQALISDPAWPVTITLTSPTARFLHIYSPRAGGFFAAEPVTHAPSALTAPEASRVALGLRTLLPGQMARMEMRIGVRERKSGIVDA